MKLLLCRDCYDVFRLRTHIIPRWCQCKKSWGRYTFDRYIAEVGGRAVILGFSNFRLAEICLMGNRDYKLDTEPETAIFVLSRLDPTLTHYGFQRPRTPFPARPRFRLRPFGPKETRNQPR